MRFDLASFVAYDLHILRRPAAREAHSGDQLELGDRWYASMSDIERATLSQTIGFGLPGEPESLTPDSIRDRLAAYAGMNEEGLRRHFIDFLSEIAPHAEKLGLRLCCHPDDPPFPLLG